ncbi:MAG: hypothetical protein MJ025_06665 [Victivallaceae bacterium]|nr:hypothetical protein [Victivallaceae bacterium]
MKCKIKYVNFRGKSYFVRPRRGCSGYVCSTKESDTDLESLPEGMEFYERADGFVGVRKKLKSKITAEEFALIQRECKRLAAPNMVRFELSKKAVSVYSAAHCNLSKLQGPRDKVAAIEDYIDRNATYMPSLRFTISDEDERIFDLERMSSLSSGEKWWFLESGELRYLVEKYAPHIEKESMCDFV